MLSRLRHWSRHLSARLPAALPSCCALCGISADNTICDDCLVQFFGRCQHRCRQCAIPLGTETSGPTCGDCLKHTPAFDATIVATDYAPPVDHLVLALKFGNRLELAPLMARMLYEASLEADTLPLPMHLTAVPLGAQRLKERGFNQALEIAKPLASRTGIKLDASLAVRQRETGAQALLHPDERHRNMRQAFTVPAAAIERIRGAHIGIVDDVMTTGTTLNELAATFKRFGAAHVTNFVFARTLPD